MPPRSAGAIMRHCSKMYGQVNLARKLILHIGRHKCGTTSIQRALFGNREELARLGFFYPMPHKPEIAHHWVANALSDKRFGLSSDSLLRQNVNYVLQGRRETTPLKVAPEMLKRILWLTRSGRLFGLQPAHSNSSSATTPGRSIETHNRRIHADKTELEAFRQSLLDADQECAVVSSEAFQNCTPGEVGRYFKGIEVHPVCYIREQATYLRSSYAQRIHASYYSGSVEEYFHTVFHADYQKFVREWRRAFRGRLNVRRFELDELHKGNVVIDFLAKVLGLKPGQYQAFQLPEAENPSLSATMLAFKLKLNREGYRMEPRVYRLLITLESKDAVPYQIPADLAASVRSRYRRSNEALARELCPGEPLFSIPDTAPLTASTELTEHEFQALLQTFEEAAPGCIRRG
jgi:hypothetical protein